MNRGCVNHLMHDAIKRDSVWIRAFKQDSKEDLDVVLKNEWLSRKWSLLNPGESKTEESESCVCCETDCYNYCTEERSLSTIGLPFPTPLVDEPVVHLLETQSRLLRQLHLFCLRWIGVFDVVTEPRREDILGIGG